MEVTRFKTPKGKDAFSLDGYCFRVDKRSADGERVFLLGTAAYASRPRVQIYSFAYSSRSIHHSPIPHLVLTPVTSLLTKPTPQGSSFVPLHACMS